MFLNYLRIALRTLMKFKAYAVINLAGLALGLATGMFVLMYVLDETSYDAFHAHAGRIYRVCTDIVDIKSGAVSGSIETNGWPIGQLLKEDYPEVEEVAYIKDGRDLFVNQGEKRFEEGWYYASEDFLRIFSFPLIEGNADNALTQPNSVVITRSMEKKYFGDQPALGKPLSFVDTLSFVVTGVLEDIPARSHMQFDMLISFATYYTEINPGFAYDDGWGNLNVRNYILLREDADVQSFFANAHDIYMNHVKEGMEKWGMYMYVDFEPLRDVYLKSERGNGMGPSGSIERVYLVSGIAVFVILLACINFVNLTTARSVHRAREVGLRKVVGSSRRALIRQFLGESLILTLLSFVMAIVLVQLLMPLFNQLVGKDYTPGILLRPELIGGMALLIIGIAFLAGFYPAVVMSGMRPAQVLKGKAHMPAGGTGLRRSLVVFQFIISTILIVGTVVVVSQLDYMKNRDLGFYGDQVLVINTSHIRSRDFPNPATFKNELKDLAMVSNVTFTNAVPGHPGWVGQWARPAEKSPDETIGTEYMAIDEDFVSTLGLTLIAGHNFDPARPAELDEGLLVNETTVKMMGWEDAESAIGKEIDSPSKYPAGTVIGVVKDYHEFGLQKDIYPMAMDYNPRYGRYYAVKFNTAATGDMLSGLQQIWRKHFPGYDFDYFFLDKDFERQYQSEQRLARVFAVFASMTILIAVIGLVGLVSFMVVSRTKEIGVRKILGANMASITGLLSREFVYLVLIANLIAVPLAWYLWNRWLEEFAFRTHIGAGVFLLAAAAGLVIAVGAVSAQTVRAARVNPVKTLRYE